MISPTEAELRLVELIRQRPAPAPSPRALVLTGAPGVGKTTTARTLARPGVSVFFERPEENPYLSRLLRGDPAFAYRCQSWFIAQVENFLLGVSPDSPLIVDQDPATTVLIYGRALRSRGLLSEEESNELVQQLEGIEALLARWPSYEGVLLDLPLADLQERILRRSADRPELFWLDELREEFSRLALRVPYKTLDVRGLDRGQTADAVSAICET